MARLRSARLTNETLVSQIDDFVGELESDIAAIFGFTLDTDITASAFSIDNSGRITKQLVAWSAPWGTFPYMIGLDLVDTSISQSASFGLMYVDVIEGGIDVGALPMLVFGAIHPASTNDYVREETFPALGFLLGTGADLMPYDHIWGYIFTSTAQGLVPPGGGNVNQHLCSDGTFKTVGRPTETVRLYAPRDAGNPSSNTTFSTGASEDLLWHSESFDATALHATDDDELIVITAGRFLVEAQVAFQPEALDPGYYTIKLWRDRGGADVQMSQSVHAFDGAADDFTLQTKALIDCAAADKLYVQVIYDNGGFGGVYTLNALESNCHFSAARIS